ncbi:FAD-dependent oxidoreductase [Streptomyces sp. NPDC014676]|uniref:FAD-dependent oxidoreductase n=1 Tax=Streptomyces sp. NPDC014676 TaxID=3364879 RepID=UPI0037025C35
MAPRTSLLRNLVELDSDGRVRVDAGMRTSVEGLFAVGDLRSDFAGYAIAAAGDGAAAAGSARRLVRSWCRDRQRSPGAGRAWSGERGGAGQGAAHPGSMPRRHRG